jgi:hypothetical protein
MLLIDPTYSMEHITLSKANNLSAISDNNCFLMNPNFYYIFQHYTPLKTYRSQFHPSNTTFLHEAESLLKIEQFLC